MSKIVTKDDLFFYSRSKSNVPSAAPIHRTTNCIHTMICPFDFTNRVENNEKSNMWHFWTYFFCFHRCISSFLKLIMQSKVKIQTNIKVFWNWILVISHKPSSHTSNNFWKIAKINGFRYYIKVCDNVLWWLAKALAYWGCLLRPADAKVGVSYPVI